MSLDPPDWEEFRRLARNMIDELFVRLENVRELPVWRSMPPEVRDRLEGALPTEGLGLEAALEQLSSDILPYSLGNPHPRFWGWVVGSGDPVGVLADLIASAMNPNVFAGDQAGTHVEAQVIEWARQALGLPPETRGVLTSGCAVANLTGLAIARHAKAAIDWSGNGLASPRRLPVLYYSAEAHNSIFKAARILGFGANSLRSIPARNYRLDVELLDQAIAADMNAGHLPFCVAATAGTVNTGAIDPLDEIADIAAQYGLWLHVDGAFGAWAALIDEYRSAMSGLPRADSLAFDFHKWMYAPYSVACLLTRHPDLHLQTFSAEGAYLATDERGIMSHRGFGALGIELGREFRSLKVWLSLKTHGIGPFREAIERNIQQARSLGDLVQRERGLELLAEVTLNIVCFRAIDSDLSEEELNHLNREIMLRVQESGEAVLSSTLLDGRFALRVAITNHRTRLSDIEALVSMVLHCREEVLGGEKARLMRSHPGEPETGP